MRISDWSSDVCSSDLQLLDTVEPRRAFDGQHGLINQPQLILGDSNTQIEFGPATTLNRFGHFGTEDNRPSPPCFLRAVRSEEHTSELQSLMRSSNAVFCLKKKKHKKTINIQDKQ